MKNISKLIGNLNRARSAKVPLLIIALAAVIGFSFSACDDGGGGSPSVDTTALNAAIQDARDARDGIIQASNASEVPTGRSWVTEDAWNAFDRVYKTAVETKANPSSQQAVDAAKTNLRTALVTFKDAKSAGSAAAIKLSGTITVKYNGQIVPYIGIQPHNDAWSWQGYIKVPLTDENTPWEIIIAPFSSPTEISFDINCFDDDKYENLLFSTTVAGLKKTIYNTDVTDIIINPENLTFVTISGTFNCGQTIPSVAIDMRRKEDGLKLGSVSLNNAGNNTPWSMKIPSQAANTDVNFNIVGFDGPLPWDYDQLFAFWGEDFGGVKVGSQDKTGIALNLGDITD